MAAILEGIFKGFLQWLYSLSLELMEYAADALLDVFSMDLSYFRQTVPITQDILSILIAAGWALLLGNTVFQAARSMMAGLGLEGEDPRLLFTRTFLFGFLLLASQQICDTGLSISGRVVRLLRIPDSFTLTLPVENAFQVGSAWLLVIIVGFVLMWQFIKLFFEIAERYVLTAVLVLAAPLAFAMGGSKSTEDIFKGWCRMFGSMCLMMVLNVVFLKLMLSAMGAVPEGAAVLPWMLFITGIARVARKADSIVARIGLAPAVTGEGLGRGLPGMVALAVVRSVSAAVTKTAAGGRHAKSSSSSSRTKPPQTPPGSGGKGVFGENGRSTSAGTGKGASAGTGTTAKKDRGSEKGKGSSKGRPPDGGTKAAQNSGVRQGGGSGSEPVTGQKDRSTAPGPSRPSRDTRRSSVPPEAKARTQPPPGTETARQAPHGVSGGGTSGEKGTFRRPDGPGTQQRPPAHPRPKPGPGGSTRKSSVEQTGHTQSSTEVHTQSSSRVRGGSKPVRQDGTQKITPPPGVTGSRGPGAPGVPQPSNSSRPFASGSASAGTQQAPNSTRPPVSGGGPSSGIAGTRRVSDAAQPPVNGGGASSGTAGTRKVSGTIQPPINGGGASSGTAGTRKVSDTTQPPINGGGASSGTAGARKVSDTIQPPVSGGAPSGMAGTRRTSNPSQGPVHHGAPPSDGTGAVPPVHPGQGTQHISGAKPPVTGAAGKAKRKGRKRHG